MTPDAFRKLALSLPEAHETPHFDRASFRVGTKIFATMTTDGKEAMVRVAPGRVHDLLTDFPEVFFSYGGWTVRNGSLGVRLAKVKVAMMRELVTDSWRHVAPKASRGAASKASRPPASKASRPPASKASRPSASKASPPAPLRRRRGE